MGGTHIEDGEGPKDEVGVVLLNEAEGGKERNGVDGTPGHRVGGGGNLGRMLLM